MKVSKSFFDFDIATIKRVGDKFGESLVGSQAPPSFWEVPGPSPEVPRSAETVLRKVPARNGVPREVLNKVLRAPSPRETELSRSLGTPFQALLRAFFQKGA